MRKATIHQLKIDFCVTPQIKRYVYVYIIEGKFCYLIDSGVDGAEKIISDYLHSIGRDMTDIRKIFLTHAHPDHIGGAARIKEMTGCTVYSSAGEQRWIEQIDQQFSERPIPNFYTLVRQSTAVDQVLRDGDWICLEDGLTLRALGTPGHSCDELSYLLPEQHCVFTGDTIPVRGDIPIWIHKADNRNSLKTLMQLDGIETYFPAWDVTYGKEQAIGKIKDALLLMDELQENVDRCKESTASQEELVEAVCRQMHTPFFRNNPLFGRTVASML